MIVLGLAPQDPLEGALFAQPRVLFHLQGTLRIIQVEDCQLSRDRLVLRYHLYSRTRKCLWSRRKGCTTAVRLVTTLGRLITLIDNGGHLMKKLLIAASIVK